MVSPPDSKNVCAYWKTQLEAIYSLIQIRRNFPNDEDGDGRDRSGSLLLFEFRIIDIIIA